IHMFQTGVMRLLKLFPRGNQGIDPALVKQYNDDTRCEIESIRDFIIMHYHMTEREDTEFWRYTKNMKIPESIDHRIRLFKDSGHAYMDSHDLFRIDSWAQVMVGQRVMPRSYHPAADVMDPKALKKYLNDFRIAVKDAVVQLPQHQDFIDRYCRAQDDAWNQVRRSA
ncbi:MAG: tryptophan 7-halogenase, partial [Povalibacter sp.]